MRDGARHRKGCAPTLLPAGVTAVKCHMSYVTFDSRIYLQTLTWVHSQQLRIGNLRNMNIGCVEVEQQR